MIDMKDFLDDQWNSPENMQLRHERKMLAKHLVAARGLPTTWTLLGDAMESAPNDETRRQLAREVCDLFLLSNGLIPVHGTVEWYPGKSDPL